MSASSMQPGARPLSAKRRYLTLEQLPVFSGSGEGGATVQISRYLRELFERRRDKTGFVRLYLPPPRQLYGFLNCTDADLQAALADLAGRGYGYTIYGPDRPLEIHDDIGELPVGPLKRLFAG